jgi:hypothetical protein
VNLSLVGLFVSLWVVVGVWIAAKRYSGYNHKHQFLSELGALGAPTQKFSPIINNFPLSLLFILFGGYLILSVDLLFIGICVVVHGIGTFVAGLFSMDKDAYTTTPSLSCKIHTIAGSAIFTARLGVVFQVISFVASLLTVLFTVQLAREFALKRNVGLFQRLSYGSQLLWLSCLSLYLSNVMSF